MAHSDKTNPQDDRDYVAAAARRYRLTGRMEAAARLHFGDLTEFDAARELTIHAGTLKGRIRTIYAKMNVHSKAQFMKCVYEAWIEETLDDHSTHDS